METAEKSSAPAAVTSSFMLGQMLDYTSTTGLARANVHTVQLVVNL